MQPVFRALELTATALARVSGTRVTYDGLDHIPRAGGAVLAINHTGYVDFLPAGLAVYHRGRRMRFMIKAEMQQVTVVNFLIKHTGTIPVDRRAGADGYRLAVAALRAGELVGVYPEATISRSFELEAFKTGAARMAAAAQVPIVPLIVWGAHRIWTKDHPKKLWRNKIPVMVRIGPPMAATDDTERTNADLRQAMTGLLERAQLEYPHPPGAYWVPRRLGGGAPTVAEARRLRAAELAERDRVRAASGSHGGRRRR